MFQTIFNSSFYFKYRIPNFDEFLEFVENNTKKEDCNFSWNAYCKVKTNYIFIDESKTTIFQPALELLANDIGPFNFKIFDPWLNTYKRGAYQEIHDHVLNDIASVFFLNMGDNFGQFFFTDRNSPLLTPNVKKQINYSDLINDLNIQAGDVIFFPGHLLHGVTPHDSDVDRKTVAANFNIVPR